MIRSKKIILPFLISISCFAALHSLAQKRPPAVGLDQYRAINWTMEDGLPWNGTNIVLKDVKGFLWAGSLGGGLARFDGAGFKKYLPDQHKRGAINSDVIFSFVEDSLNNIWIGTGNGLSRYDMKADTFTNFFTTVDSFITDRSVIPFWATNNHVYCFESRSQHILTYDIYSFEKKIRFTPPASNKLNIGAVAVTSTILDTTSNCIWMLDEQGGRPGGIIQISLDGGERQYYTWPCYRTNIIHRHAAEAMRLDPNRNSIWINSGDGLLEFSLADKQFHHVDAFNELIKLSDYDRYVGIDVDRKGRIWLATKPKGILIYDPETQDVQPVFSDAELQQRTGEDNLHIYCDRDGIVWTADYVDNGIYELLPYNPPVIRYVANSKVQNSLSNNAILTTVPAANGKMWIGATDGLNIFDPDKETFEVLREKHLPGIKGNVILPVHIDTIRQKAWLFATASIDKYWEMDMYEMDIKTRKCWPITFRDSSKRIHPRGISPNEVTPYKDGLLMCDEVHGIFEIKESSRYADLIIAFSSPIGRVVLEEDRFIFVQRGGALPNFTYENKNGKWIRIPHPTDTLNWTAMLYNKKDQTHWVSLKYELALYDKVFRKIKSYGEEDGFNGPALNMLTDNVGNLWFTNLLNQIGRLDPTTGIITTLSEADGFKKQTFGWWDSRGKDARGNLYFGGNGVSMESKGLDRIHPERYSSAKTSFVYLRSLEINQKPFPLSIGVNNLEELSLDYDQNTINIETGIIDYYAMGKGHIRYKLEESGSNADWQYSPANYTIRYEGLPPGAYRLVMQTSNAGNEFNSPEKILMINISAPFWETWWFRTMAGFSFLAILYAIIHFRSLSLKRQNLQLEEKVIVRTKELNQSLEELKSTQAQLIQSEKMASLGELTAGIAHEIQNPLNFVNNFSDLNTELVAELKDEINNENFEEVKAIAKDIADNEEKINHHGKRADAIVKGMLQHSRISSGKKEPTDINALVDEYLRLAYHGLRAKDKSFNATTSTDFDKTINKINIIPQDIGRAILNLITNAFYAVSEKEKLNLNGYKPTVTVTTKAIHDKVEIKVKDNGSGIPQKVLDKIFQPFFTTKPTGQGTGLGLSLSYDIIKAHGGEIAVKTKEGEYSEFIIQLPGKQDSQITIR